MTDPKTPRLVERVVDVLLALADGPREFTAVCTDVGLSKATAHRILKGLAYQEMVLQDPVTSRYLLGPGATRLAGTTGSGVTRLTALARPVLEQLRSDTHETVVLHVRLGRTRLNVDELISPQELRYSGGIGSSTPVHVGSAGKVLLAWLPETTVLDLLPAELVGFTSTTITDPGELLDTLRRVRNQGFAESLGERIQGLAAVSVPIFGPAGEDVVAAVSVIGPEARMPAPHRAELVEVAQGAARRISALLAETAA